MKLTPEQIAKGKLFAAHIREEMKDVIAAQANAPCCQRCGRPLSDPESIRIGMGPECAANEALDKKIYDENYAEEE